jgi:AraC-like DNA-binding protein
MPGSGWVRSQVLVRPPADLDSWLSAGVAMRFGAGDAHVSCRFPATVASAIVVATRGRFGIQAATVFHPLPQAFVAGPATGPVVLHRTRDLECVGVIVRPEAAAVLLGDTPGLLVDQLADALDVFGRGWAEVLERIALRPDAAGRLHELFGFIRGRRLRRMDRWIADGPMRLRLRHAALRGVGAGAADFGCSPRQLERRFSAQFGLGPKRFQRLARVEAAMRELLVGRGRGPECALALGYFDQSHLARDLRELAGITAGDLARVRTTSDPSLRPLRIGAAYEAAGIRSDFRAADFTSLFS